MKIIFNHAITRLYVKKKSINWYYSIVTKKVGPLFGKKVEKKFVHEAFCSLRPLDEITWKNSYVEDDTVYWKPYCIICTSDNRETEIYFETEQELIKYVDELKSKAPHIIIQ